MKAPKKTRHSIRLKNYDYSQKGYYFITICTQNRQPLFGKISNGEMTLNKAGQIIENWWPQLPKKFPHIKIDTDITMPDHIHAIIQITSPSTVRADLCVCPPSSSCTPHQSCPSSSFGSNSFESPAFLGQTMGEHMDSPLHTVIQTMDEHMGSPLHTVIQTMDEHTGSPLHTVRMHAVPIYTVLQWFKTMTTNDYIRGVKCGELAPFKRRVWQRNYWERIIRDERELNNVRAYIRNNPGKWRRS